MPRVGKSQDRKRARREMRRLFDRNRCCYCGREATECWVFPCLSLESDLASGVAAFKRWCELSGAPFTVEQKT